jgi:serine/threonine protein kinase
MVRKNEELISIDQYESPKLNQNTEIVLIDFNVARRFKDPNSPNKLLMLTNTGAPGYQAPELKDSKAYE